MQIEASASAVPEKIVTNQDLTVFMDTSDEWIRSRTGIAKRHVATTETNTSLASDVALQLLKKAGVDGSAIDFVLVATMSPDHATPGVANLVQAQIGAVHAMAMDLNAACAGFIYALRMAERLLSDPYIHGGLVIGSEVLSRLVDWSDRKTAILFADGAGGILITDDGAPIMGSDMRSIGDEDFVLTAGQAGNTSPFVTEPVVADPFFKMDGRAVFDFALNSVPNSITRALDQAQLTAADLDWLILHQANGRIVSGIQKRLKLPVEKVPIGVAEYGNTSAASIPILLNELIDQDRLKRGQTIALSGFGGGLNVGTLIFTY